MQKTDLWLLIRLTKNENVRVRPTKNEKSKLLRKNKKITKWNENVQNEDRPKYHLKTLLNLVKQAIVTHKITKFRFSYLIGS